MRIRRSRLSKKQEEKNIRLAVFYIFLTLIIAFVLVFVGIPLLIRMAIFLGTLRTSSKMPEKGDTIPPTPPRIVAPFEATNSARLSLEGYTEPGANIKLFNSGLSFGEVLADNDGVFTIENLELTSGRNEITAIAKDGAGNESQASIPIIIEYDTSEPELEISQPEDGQTISGVENQITIEGKTEEGAKLTINGRLVIVGPEGEFSYEHSLDEGENVFTIVAQDKAGNQTEKEVKVTYSP
jgi:bacillopeptidase F